MMKPNFDDVIEYVKAGEDDPGMEETLRLHPDGQELLKQARFICAALRQKHETADDSDLAAGPGGLTGAVFGVAASRDVQPTLEPRASRVPSESTPLQRPDRRPRSIDQMIESEGHDAEDLGTLEFSKDGESTVISYEPTDSVMLRYGKSFIKFTLAQGEVEGIEIRGRGITLVLPDRLPAGRSATMQMTLGVKKLPARRLALIFMPESGPFVRMKADDDGFVELPVLDQAGTLRIDSPARQVLHIKPKDQ